MHRISTGLRYLMGSALALATLGLTPRAARAQVVINEIDYDQPSTDTAEFVELKNVGPTAVNLSAYELRLLQGSTAPACPSYKVIALPNTMLAAGGYYVICGNAATVPGCNLDVTPDTDLIQNGTPDAVGLFPVGAGTTPVDVVAYEGPLTNAGCMEGTAAGTDDAAQAGRGLSRCDDGVDTDNNAADFRFRPITPGGANNCAVAGTIGACGDPATAISAIQGATLVSPLVGSAVVIEGVVVGDFQDNQINGFYVQEEDAQQDGDPATSEGIFVYESSSAVPVAVGNVVRVLGEVSEYQGLTELSGVAGVQVCPMSATVTPQTVTFPVASVTFLERYEGMSVNIAQPLTVTGNFELGRFGSLDLSVGGRLYQPTQIAAPGPAALAQQDLNDRSRIVLDDLSDLQDPNPIPYKDASNTRRVGDTLPSLAGILDGRFGAYRIEPTNPGALVFGGGNPRQSPPAVGGSLRVVTANVLNFFTTIDAGVFVCGPAGTLECRGADAGLVDALGRSEFTRQRTKTLNELDALDADIVGLAEIENNASTSLQSLVDGLNERHGGATVYAYINTGTIGTDAIKVGFIYKPARVTPVGPFRILTSAFDPAYIDTLNRPALAQTFDRIGGGRLTVVQNHLKSKGSACPGDPDAGNGQGECNGTRTAAANVLANWIATDPTGSGDPDFVVMGDLNAYAKEDPMTAFAAHGLTSPLVGTSDYDYQFDGQTGGLTHILVNSSLLGQVAGAAAWHANADEPVVIDYNLEFRTDDSFNINDAYRASDHDALVLGLSLGAPANAVPATGNVHIAILGLAFLATGAAALRARRRRRRGR